MYFLMYTNGQEDTQKNNLGNVIFKENYNYIYGLLLK